MYVIWKDNSKFNTFLYYIFHWKLSNIRFSLNFSSQDCISIILYGRNW